MLTLKKRTSEFLMMQLDMIFITKIWRNVRTKTKTKTSFVPTRLSFKIRFFSFLLSSHSYSIRGIRILNLMFVFSPSFFLVYSSYLEMIRSATLFCRCHEWRMPNPENAFWIFIKAVCLVCRWWCKLIANSFSGGLKNFTLTKPYLEFLHKESHMTKWI